MACPPNQALVCDDEANPTLAGINFSEGRVASYSNLAMSNLTSSADTYAFGWAVDATIDPALLTQPCVSSDSSAYNAYLQQP